MTDPISIIQDAIAERLPYSEAQRRFIESLGYEESIVAYELYCEARCGVSRFCPYCSAKIPPVVGAIVTIANDGCVSHCDDEIIADVFCSVCKSRVERIFCDAAYASQSPIPDWIRQVSHSDAEFLALRSGCPGEDKDLWCRLLRISADVLELNVAELGNIELVSLNGG